MQMLEELKSKLEEKLDQEYDNLKQELLNERPQIIIERASELVAKEDIKDLMKCQDFEIQELKALLKKDNILDFSYDEWMHTDVNSTEIYQDTIDKAVNKITKDYAQEKSKKSKESR